jgi:K+-sensing histidine kinase KdpD
MIQQLSPFKAVINFAMVLSFGITTVALAQTPKDQITTAQRHQMSEMHKKMADIHAKMAACLASDKAPSQCRQEMLDACSTNFGGSCPMMGKMGSGQGMGMMGNGSCMDSMMNPNSASPAMATPKK